MEPCLVWIQPRRWAPGYSTDAGGGFLYQIIDTSITTTTVAAIPTATTTSTPSSGCLDSVYDHATYLPTGLGKTATGLCDVDYTSTSHPTRLCGADGFWSPQIKNRCIGLIFFLSFFLPLP